MLFLMLHTQYLYKYFATQKKIYFFPHCHFFKTSDDQISLFDVGAIFSKLLKVGPTEPIKQKNESVISEAK